MSAGNIAPLSFGNKENTDLRENFSKKFKQDTGVDPLEEGG